MQKLSTENTFGTLCWIFLFIGFFGWLDSSDGGARLRRAIARSKRKAEGLGERSRHHEVIILLDYSIIGLFYYYIIILLYNNIIILLNHYII